MASDDVISVVSFVVLAGLWVAFAVTLVSSRSSLGWTLMSIPRQKDQRTNEARHTLEKGLQ